MKYLLTSILFTICFNVFSQKNNEDNVVKKLFFDLNVDACLLQIEKEIDSNKLFEYAGGYDTSLFREYQILTRKINYTPNFKLKDSKQSIVKCDSTFINSTPHIAIQGSAHGKVDYETLYGHRVSILCIFMILLWHIPHINSY